ncbi:MAG: glycosyltransferase family 4 protein [Alphaproteobacteria bacterium]
MKAKKELRVLQVLPALEMGGVERGTIDVAIFLKQKGHFPVIASYGGRLVSHLRKNGIIHEYLPLHSKNPFTMWMNIVRLERIIRNHQIQVVHARSRAPAWSAYFAAKKAKVPFITTFHAAYPFQSTLKKVYNSVMTKGNNIIAVSKFISNFIQQKYQVTPKKIVSIHRGIDLEVFDPEKVTQSRIEAVISQMQLPDDKFIVLLPGRLTRLKGHVVLLDALSRLKRDDVVCIFVGLAKNSEYIKELEEQALNYQLRDRLYIFPECKDMPALYKLSTVTVCPSICPESFGRTAAEAGALGCPVIASNHGGLPEIILDGETGFLFPPEDSRSLAYIIEKVLDMPLEERQKMQQKAIAHIRKHFDNTIMLTKTLKVYQDVLSHV